MRVAAFSPYCLDEVSGINQIILALARVFRPRGIGVTLHVPDGNSESPEVTVRFLPLRTRRFRNFELAARTFHAIINDDPRPDLIHTNQPTLQSLAALLAARVIRRPAIMTLHVKVPDRRWWRSGFARLEAYIAEALADRIVAVSTSVRDAFGLNRCEVVPNGVQIPNDARPSEPWGEGLMLVFCGRVTASKGIEFLLEAIRRAVPTIRGLRVRTFGPIESKETYQGLKVLLGVEGFVEDRGYDPRWRNTLKPDQVFVLPSLYEGLPLALLEAMAHGLPAIATDVGGVPEVVRDGETGLIVPPGDAGALAEAIKWMATNPHERRQLGQAAQSLVRERFTLDRVADSYARVYSAVAVRWFRTTRYS